MGTADEIKRASVWSRTFIATVASEVDAVRLLEQPLAVHMIVRDYGRLPKPSENKSYLRYHGTRNQEALCWRGPAEIY
jgi:hypothetical protein